MSDTLAPESLEGERKTVTALFADIKGSKSIEDLDPEEARAIVDPTLKLMIEAVQRYGGYVAQSTGDGIFALFGAPVVHEIIRSVHCLRHCRWEFPLALVREVITKPNDELGPFWPIAEGKDHLRPPPTAIVAT
jgi:class 3 adenylate cyclase